MDENKHTPAPWHTGRGNCHTVYSSQSNGHQQIIARCPTQNGPIDYDSHEVMLNAKLIAAAPDLLAALQRIENYLQKIPLSLAPDIAIRDALQAIQKATRASWEKHL